MGGGGGGGRSLGDITGAGGGPSDAGLELEVATFCAMAAMHKNEAIINKLRQAISRRGIVVLLRDSTGKVYVIYPGASIALAFCRLESCRFRFTELPGCTVKLKFMFNLIVH